MRKPEEIRDAIERLSSLPTIPPVVSKILRVIDADDVSIEKIGEFISSDQALSARVLKIVNSPVYGFPGRISSISQAIMLLGLSALKGMLLGVSIIDIMEKTMLGLWEHSFGTAMAARLIASKRGYKDIEDASVAGLIHDIGKVALSLCYPKEYGQVVSEAEEKGDYI
ncbi:MAG TPA: HDOD domain-containing protein, partial [Nitrospirae bacterium]|nr:HDOD domain-containing protein [Nitrospirota bacterium]